MIFDDNEIGFELLSQAIWSDEWLSKAAASVTKEDFRPTGNAESMGYVVAEWALDFWNKHKVAAGNSIRIEMEKWFKETEAGADRIDRTKKFLVRLHKLYNPARTKSLIHIVVEYKQHRSRSAAIKELVDRQSAGQLTDEEMLNLVREAVQKNTKLDNKQQVENFADYLDLRIDRRLQADSIHRRPSLMIDPLDMKIRSIGRGHIGLWVAPYKMGKSLALIWTATAYLYQGLNVLFFTLEDPLTDVEDRFDACISELPIADLGVNRDILKRRIEQVKKQLHTQLKIIDGTGGDITVPKIEAIWESQAASGFKADAVLVDYDDEIRPVFRHKDPRLDMADIYREFRQFTARKQIISWLAAQAVRNAEGAKEIKGKMIAEDISKIRKVTISIGIGQGEWGPDSRYLYVQAHKLDKQFFGMNIWSDPSKAVFYDRDRTLKYWRETTMPEDG